MPYDEGLAQRILDALGERDGLESKKMFGGVGYMLRGNMSVGVHGDELIVRVGPRRYEEALRRPHARPFDMTGRPMKGWIWVGQEGFEDDEDLDAWVQLGVDFALSLPPK